MSPDRESALRAIEDRYGALPEKLPSVAYIYEPGLDGRCLYISPSIERVLGYTREKWLGDYAIWDRLVHPDDYPRVTASEAEVRSLRRGAGAGVPAARRRRPLGLDPGRDDRVAWPRRPATRSSTACSST